MRKDILFISILTTLIISGCHRENKVNRTSENGYETLVDTNNIAIIPFDTTGRKESADFNRAELTIKDIKMIDSLLNYCVEKYNIVAFKRYEEFQRNQPESKLVKSDFLIDIKEYKRQYTPVVNKKGEKIVWIFCLCHTNDNRWKKEKLLIKDGGKCYFNVQINLKTGECSEIITHCDA